MKQFLLIALSLLFLYACSRVSSPTWNGEERINITVYQNEYDDDNRLIKSRINTRMYHYEWGLFENLFFEDIHTHYPCGLVRTHRYTIGFGQPILSRLLPRAWQERVLINIDKHTDTTEEWIC